MRNIRNENEELQMDTENILVAWHKYFRAKFEDEEEEQKQKRYYLGISGKRCKIVKRKNNIQTQRRLGRWRSNKDKQNGNAVRKDRITTEMFKFGGHRLTVQLR